MKIINWKPYKELKLKDLSKDELLIIIEDLQERVWILEGAKGGLTIESSQWINKPLTIQEWDRHNLCS